MITQAQLPFIERTVHETHDWLNQIKEKMNTDDDQQAYHALRGVLFAIRDRLPIEESTDFSAQFPMLIRGLYFEGYNPVKQPLKYRDKQEFLSRVHQEYHISSGEDPQAAAQAVFAVLKDHVTEGQMKQVLDALPKGISNIAHTH